MRLEYSNGEGGMVVTDNEELAKKISSLGCMVSRDALKRFEHSKNKTYDVEAIGCKANLTIYNLGGLIH